MVLWPGRQPQPGVEDEKRLSALAAGLAASAAKVRQPVGADEPLRVVRNSDAGGLVRVRRLLPDVAGPRE